MLIKKFYTFWIIFLWSVHGCLSKAPTSSGIKTNDVHKTKQAAVADPSVTYILNKLSHIETELHSQRLHSKQQQKVIQQQNGKIKRLERVIQRIENEEYAQPDMQYEGANYGCPGDVINLSCSDGKTIVVLAAEYGEYADDAYCGEDECCIPHPDDCSEQVVDNNSADWLVLKLECDNRTECDHLFQASTFIENCTVSEIVDYMTIYYTCLPENPDQTVAFTAFTERTREFAEGEVIRFEKTITNLGNYYHANSSVFICPFSGLYQFSMFVVGNVNSTVHANIMIGGTQMVIAWADAVANTYTQASNSLLVDCNEGQKVWVQSSSSGAPGSMFSNTWKHSTFSGVMLKRFE